MWILIKTIFFFCFFDSHNTEKVIYFLLLERKRRRPAFEDDTEAIVRVRSESSDPPRKRIDTCKVNGTATYQFGQISEGSPLTPRRQQFKYVNFMVLSCNWVSTLWNTKLIWTEFKKSAPVSNKTQHISITKISWLLQFKKIIVIYTDNHMKPINTLCEQIKVIDS
jgi:hypothetical protein